MQDIYGTSVSPCLKSTVSQLLALNIASIPSKWAKFDDESDFVDKKLPFTGLLADEFENDKKTKINSDFSYIIEKKYFLISGQCFRQLLQKLGKTLTING